MMSLAPHKPPNRDICDEVQRRVHFAREQEIQRQVDQILARDRLLRENKDRLAKEAIRIEEAYVPRESYTTDDPPYTLTYSPLYTRSHSFAPSIVQQTMPRVDSNAAILQELLEA
ncbi:hypothetical protein LIER_01892 [Lithospermum erythrorhizon]|uniref:Uncharacterized protein n=1 Tax=Lithospermum erythrorhizon TaxID=34254 RepID=A0AAV3NP27_LITER